MSRKFNVKKHALSVKQNVKSWNSGTKRKLIAIPANIMTKSSRNGLILT